MKLVTLDSGPCRWCGGSVFKSEPNAEGTFQLGHDTPICPEFIAYMEERGGKNRRAGTLTLIHQMGSSGTFIDTPKREQ